MKNINTLQEKALVLLEMANDMQTRIDYIKDNQSYFGADSIRFNNDRIATCERGKKRLLTSYKKVLTQIIEL